MKTYHLWGGKGDCIMICHKGLHSCCHEHGNRIDLSLPHLTVRGFADLVVGDEFHIRFQLVKELGRDQPLEHRFSGVYTNAVNWRRRAIVEFDSLCVDCGEKVRVRASTKGRGFI